MHKVVIKKGNHRPLIQKPGLFINKKRYVYRFRLDYSWKYKLVEEDQLDISKITGVGYLPWWRAVITLICGLFWITLKDFHHKYSWRLGVHYNPLIESNYAFFYVYDSGNRFILPLGKIQNMVDYTLVVDVYNDEYLAQVWNGNELIGTQKCPKTHNYHVGLKLGTYFGGNRKAPHSIITYIKSLNKWIGQLSFYYL